MSFNDWKMACATLLNFKINLWYQSFVLPTLYVHVCLGNIHLVDISYQVLYWTLSIHLSIYIDTTWKQIQLQKEKYNHLNWNKANKGT